MSRDNHGREPIIVRIATPEANLLFEPGLLSAADRARFERLRSPLHRQEFRVSRALQQHCHAHSSAVSLSHSGGLAASACGPVGVRLGVDLELHRPRRIQSIARFAYAPDEAAWVASKQAGGERLFYGLWVAKEAMAKALGISLVEALRGCSYSCDDGFWRGAAPTTEPWTVTILQPRPDLSLAVAQVGQGAAEDCLITREWPPEREVEWPVIARVTSDSK